MKTKILLFLLCLSSLSVTGQDVVTRQSTQRQEAKKQQKTEQVTKPKTSPAKQVSQPSGYVNGHGYVDLGLPSGTKWATSLV